MSKIESSQLKRFEHRLDTLEEKLELIYNKLERIDKLVNEFIQFDTIPEEFRENKAFLAEENWILEQKSLYPEDVILYTKRDGELKLIAHFKEFDSVRKLLDDLIDENAISQEDPLFFA